MKRKIKDYFRFFLYKLFRFLLLLLPKKYIKIFLLFLAKIAYKYNKKHKLIAYKNLNLVYGDTISVEKKENIIKKSYLSLIYNMYEFFQNQIIQKEELLSKGHLINGHYLDDYIKDKRKIIFITAHYGGWELAIPYIALKFGKLAVVNRKMDNPLINDIYVKARDKNNVIMLEKKVAAKGMINAFKKDYFVAVAIDQDIKYGIEVDFLGKKVMATDSTSRLALKFDAIIVPVFAILNDFQNYNIKICEPIDVGRMEFKTDDKIKELTQLQADIMSNQILEIPHLWFWQHKRFKKFYKNIYQEGKL